jgi:hypothetical protein
MSAFLLAAFPTPEKMAAAGKALLERGYDDLDGYSPYPVKEFATNVGIPRSGIALRMLLGGLSGAVGAYLLQVFCNKWNFPIDVGGRPLHAFATNIPVTFECAVLFSALTGFISVFTMSGLPNVTHPVFESEAFRSATLDAFWVSVAAPPGEDSRLVLARELESLGATTVSIVEAA